jgi:hypothetical protein
VTPPDGTSSANPDGPADPTDSPDQPPERAERRPVNLPGFAARADGSTMEITLTDLSYDGCGIETAVEFTLGETLQLSVLDYGAIVAEVRWIEDGHAGLVFETAAAPDKQHWPRRSDRVTLAAEVALRRPGRLNYRVRVFDVSPEGCQLEFVERPEVDEYVWMKFDGLEALEARVCWVDGFKAGIKYASPIHPAVFDLLLARLQG